MSNSNFQKSTFKNFDQKAQAKFGVGLQRDFKDDLKTYELQLDAIQKKREADEKNLMKKLPVAILYIEEIEDQESVTDAEKAKTWFNGENAVEIDFDAAYRYEYDFASFFGDVIARIDSIKRIKKCIVVEGVDQSTLDEAIIKAKQNKEFIEVLFIDGMDQMALANKIGSVYDELSLAADISKELVEKLWACYELVNTELHHRDFSEVQMSYFTKTFEIFTNEGTTFVELIRSLFDDMRLLNK